MSSMESDYLLFPVYRPDHVTSLQSRRCFLKFGAMLGSALTLGGMPVLLHDATRRLGDLPADPFSLGVASGDPTPDSVVLWTRLTNEVLTEAGAASDAVDVGFEILDSSSFRNIVRRGAIAAVPELDHCAHADVRGLAADTEYFWKMESRILAALK